MRGEKVVLTGMSGAGKTATGQTLSELLVCSWVDIDAEVEREVGSSISELIRVEGEQRFRALETQMIEQAVRSDVGIIAIGGGALVSQRNRELLQNTVLVHLAVSDSELCERLIADERRANTLGQSVSSQTVRRPIIFGGMDTQVLDKQKVKQKLSELRRQRQALYEQAQLTVWTDFAPSKQVALAVARGVQKKKFTKTIIIPDSQFGSVMEANIYHEVTIGELGETLAANMLQRWPASTKVVVVVDQAIENTAGENVLQILKATFASSQRLTIASGEKAKTFEVVIELIDKFSEWKLTREDVVVAVGGGAIGDAVGLAASLYLRGIGLVHVPTTVVAQVDSAIGGKTAVNTAYGKNSVGTFYPAQFVCIDVELLKTLPDREFISGLAEVVKYGLIASADFVEWLEQNVENILKRDKQTLQKMVEFSVVTKQRTVRADLHDTSGIRAVLNFGHTIGHAIEKLSGYGQVLHGEAVSVGMVEALKLGASLKKNDLDLVKRVALLLQKFRLPVEMPAGLLEGAAEFLKGGAAAEGIKAVGTGGKFVERWKEAILADKKRSGDEINFILLERVGKAEVVRVPLLTILRSVATAHSGIN